MDGLPQYFWGIVTVTSAGEITGEVLPFPVCRVTTEGPLVVEVNKTYTFTATAHPPEAQLPITYIWWSGYDQSPIVHANGISDSVELFLTTGGWNQIFLCLKNPPMDAPLCMTIFIMIEFNNLIYIPSVSR